MRGLARLRVPKVGLPALWLREGRALPVLGAFAALIALGRLARTTGTRRGTGVRRSADPAGNSVDQTRTPVIVQTFIA
ncbi:hypothetical protein [Dactylosporangium sp. NPDC000521]|uniref:hypothetical protein n=1 Tax=Dactylosporangium sp. NPDC000521 TaxID=3363975 RepID=UPI0036A93F2B